MILSGTITLDPASHAATTASLHLGLEQLEERRRSAERSVDIVLATWQGDAAERFRGRWVEWRSPRWPRCESAGFTRLHA